MIDVIKSGSIIFNWLANSERSTGFQFLYHLVKILIWQSKRLFGSWHIWSELTIKLSIVFIKASRSQSKVIYNRVLTTVWVRGTKDLESLGQQVLATIFLYFNLKRKPIFTKKCSPHMISIQKIVLKNYTRYIKICNLDPFCFLWKVRYWEENL